MVDYTRSPTTQNTSRVGAIQSVDVVNQMAQLATNNGNVIDVDTSYYVGATQVTPTVGDQWVVQRSQAGGWQLQSRLPFNDPNQTTTTPTSGQHVVGSGQGPVQLQGTLISVNAPLSTQATPTTGRPSASSVPAGTQIYDSTLGKPIWSNGSAWHDATGASV
jgi:hypothetical protein